MLRHQPDKLAAFAAAVAHELNEELTVILNAVHLLLDEVPREHPVRHALEQLESATSRCTGMTDGLLELTRNRGYYGSTPLRELLASD